MRQDSTWVSCSFWRVTRNVVILKQESWKPKGVHKFLSRCVYYPQPHHTHKHTHISVSISSVRSFPLPTLVLICLCEAICQGVGYQAQGSGGQIRTGAKLCLVKLHQIPQEAAGSETCLIAAPRASSFCPEVPLLQLQSKPGVNYSLCESPPKDCFFLFH